MDGEGRETDDPCKMLDEDGGLHYLGGSEETGGYKGYGLGMMVEVLGGILGGGAFGKNIRYWKNDSRIANLVRDNIQWNQVYNAWSPPSPQEVAVIELL